MRTSIKLNHLLEEHELRINKRASGTIEVTVINDLTGDAFMCEGHNWSTVIGKAFNDLKKQQKKAKE